jgi:membrane-bound lytic murein transglycosylase B
MDCNLLICPGFARFSKKPLRVTALLFIVFTMLTRSVYGEPWSECLSRLQTEALQQGLQAATVRDILAKAQPIERVIELDRHQPEFTSTFADYLNRRVTQTRVDKGRKLYKKYHKLLTRITRQTGVPGQYLLAFWGLETNYGSYMGEVPTINALATLACDKRRARFFSQQLFAALQLVEKENFSIDQMQGSWAGAVGHVQFMPSVYLKYAKDGDGDQRRDLWRSVDDALHSAGFYLQSIGWKTGSRWGREVVLPKNFPYHYAGLQKPRALSAWARLGVIDVYGRPLPTPDMQASLIIPSGYEGPAFLVYQNFKTIMGWNRSEFYALSVGHLADRIAGAGQLHNPPPTDSLKLNRELIKQLQSKLKAKGFKVGKPDGIFGPASRNALREYQQAEGLVADGFIDAEVLAKFALLPIPEEKPPARESR